VIPDQCTQACARKRRSGAIRREHSSIALSVVDDGIGFAEETTRRALTGMRERVNALGGTSGSQRMDAKTVVSCLIPAHQPAETVAPAADVPRPALHVRRRIVLFASYAG